MSRSLPYHNSRTVSFQAATAGPFDLEHPGALTASAPRLRCFLIVAIVAALPVNIVYFASNNEPVNVAICDVFMPLGILFLTWLFVNDLLRLPVVTLCLLAIGITALSILCNLNISFLNKGGTGMAIEIIKVVLLWLYFYLFVNLVQDRSDLRLLIKIWILGSIFEAVCGIGGSLAYQLAGRETLFADMFRAQGTLGDANLFATHLEASFFLTLLYRRVSGQRPIWTTLAMLVQVAGVYFSASRGGLLSFGASLFVLWLFALTGWQKLVAIAGMGAMILAIAVSNPDGLLLSNQITKRLSTSTVSLDDPEAQQRARLWKVAIRGFQDSPVLGVGRGNFVYLDALNSQGGRSGRAHNTCLEILCETGLAGLLTYLAFVLAVLAGLARDWWHHPAPDRRLANSVLFTSLVVIGLNGMTISIENYRGLWILLALVLAYHRLYLTPRTYVAATAPDLLSARASA